MSQATVELVRGLLPGPDVDIAALFRDEDSVSALLDAVAPLFHPDFEATVITGVGQDSYPGLDGLRKLWLDWLEPWASYRSEIKDIIDFGDRVLVLPLDYGRRRGSQSEVSMHGAAVWTVAGGQVIRAAFYSDRAEALEAAGAGSSRGEFRQPLR